tara:strand:+ start:4842 stop:6251 length:1410 start_codon:yes stop_codon:yes gene_type:complete
MTKQQTLDVKNLFNLAIKYQKEKNFYKAKKLYQKILDFNPDFLEANNNLGLLFQFEKEYDKAIECYKKIIDINPKILSAQFNLGLVFQKMGKNENAKECYKKAIKLNPKLVNAQYNLGIIFQKLGENENAKECYKKAIELNPKLVIAHNNLGIVYSNLGNYNLATDSYVNALEIDKNFKSAKENLIQSLTCSNSERNNPIIDANNRIKKIHKSFNLLECLKSENLNYIFRESNKILKSIEGNIKEVCYDETQTYRRNAIDLNCKRHHEVFNELKLIPKFCFSCFKIQIEPKSILDLIKLFFIFDNFNFENNNWRKCMIELRNGVSGVYKGFVYCSSNEEAEKILSQINPLLKKFLIFNVKIKRGCTEFYEKFPKYKEINNINDNFMYYVPSWQQREKKYDLKTNSNKKIFIDTLPGLSISDYLIMNNWLNYAKIIGDLSFDKITDNFLYSEYVSQITSRQLEFRKKELI